MAPVAGTTGGQALAGQGFTRTACMDTSRGHPGVRLTGTFDPLRTDSLGRYGIDILRPGITFIPEQYTGSHSTGLNSLAVGLLPEVFWQLGVTVEPDRGRDQADLDMLVGATPWVLAKAVEFGILAVDEPSGQPVGPPPPPVPAPGSPVQPPQPAPPVQPSGPSSPSLSGLHPLSPASVRVEELRGLLDVVWGVAPERVWFEPPLALIQHPHGWESLAPFAVEALRFYRLLRARLGDPRVIPQEDQ